MERARRPCSSDSWIRFNEKPRSPPWDRGFALPTFCLWRPRQRFFWIVTDQQQNCFVQNPRGWGAGVWFALLAGLNLRPLSGPRGRSPMGSGRRFRLLLPNEKRRSPSRRIVVPALGQLSRIHPQIQQVFPRSPAVGPIFAHRGASRRRSRLPSSNLDRATPAWLRIACCQRGCPIEIALSESFGSIGSVRGGLHRVSAVSSAEFDFGWIVNLLDRVIVLVDLVCVIHGVCFCKPAVNGGSSV